MTPRLMMIALLLPPVPSGRGPGPLDQLQAMTQRIGGFGRLLHLHAANGLRLEGAERQVLAAFLAQELPRLARSQLLLLRLLQGGLPIGDPRELPLRRLEADLRRAIQLARRLTHDLGAQPGGGVGGGAQPHARSVVIGRVDRLVAHIARSTQLIEAFALPLAHCRLGEHELATLQDAVASGVDRDQHH